MHMNTAQTKQNKLDAFIEFRLSFIANQLWMWLLIMTPVSVASHIQTYWVPEGSIRETMSQQRNLRMRRDLDVCMML